MMNDDGCATTLQPNSMRMFCTYSIMMRYYTTYKMPEDDNNAMYATPKSQNHSGPTRHQALVGYLVFNLNPASCSAKNIGPLLSSSCSGLSSVAYTNASLTATKFACISSTFSNGIAESICSILSISVGAIRTENFDQSRKEAKG